MVSEVQVDDERMVRDLLKDDNRNRGMRGNYDIIKFSYDPCGKNV